MWRAETRGDRTYMERVLSDDFREVGRSGRVYAREEILELPVGEIDAQLRHIAVAAIAADVALVTYVSVVRGADGNIERAHRSSLWVHSDNGWKLRWHQGTPTSD